MGSLCSTHPTCCASLRLPTAQARSTPAMSGFASPTPTLRNPCRFRADQMPYTVSQAKPRSPPASAAWTAVDAKIDGGGQALGVQQIPWHIQRNPCLQPRIPSLKAWQGRVLPVTHHSTQALVDVLAKRGGSFPANGWAPPIFRQLEQTQFLPSIHPILRR